MGESHNGLRCLRSCGPPRSHLWCTAPVEDGLKQPPPAGERAPARPMCAAQVSPSAIALATPWQTPDTDLLTAAGTTAPRGPSQSAPSGHTYTHTPHTFISGRYRQNRSSMRDRRLDGTAIILRRCNNQQHFATMGCGLPDDLAQATAEPNSR